MKNEKITVKKLEENLVAITKCEDNISKLNGVEYVWHYCKTDNLYRHTKVWDKENADSIIVHEEENVLNYPIFLELK